MRPELRQDVLSQIKHENDKITFILTSIVLDVAVYASW